ncbi:hypothetical protein Cadr_000003688 [Camelus dromedarius]|uniref:Uncharacterized protein n=1 Tax=Camelus dromedarius TaxID=9838 RepID=A0A5N4C2Y2_CAMDR|nr:hypothetical protein Cadr_000003688 [Camelus dromedarius]
MKPPPGPREPIRVRVRCPAPPGRPPQRRPSLRPPNGQVSSSGGQAAVGRADGGSSGLPSDAGPPPSDSGGGCSGGGAVPLGGAALAERRPRNFVSSAGAAGARPEVVRGQVLDEGPALSNLRPRQGSHGVVGDVRAPECRPRPSRGPRPASADSAAAPPHDPDPDPDPEPGTPRRAPPSARQDLAGRPARAGALLAALPRPALAGRGNGGGARVGGGGRDPGTQGPLGRERPRSHRRVLASRASLDFRGEAAESFRGWRRRPWSGKRLAAPCVPNPEIIILFAHFACVFCGRLWLSSLRGARGALLRRLSEQGEAAPVLVCLKVNGGGETLYVLWMGGWEMPGTWLCGWLAWSGQAPTPGRPLDEGAEGYTAPCPGICPLPRCGDRSPAVLILRAWKREHVGPSLSTCGEEGLAHGPKAQRLCKVGCGGCSDGPNGLSGWRQLLSCLVATLPSVTVRRMSSEPDPRVYTLALLCRKGSVPCAGDSLGGDKGVRRLPSERRETLAGRGSSEREQCRGDSVVSPELSPGRLHVCARTHVCPALHTGMRAVTVGAGAVSMEVWEQGSGVRVPTDRVCRCREHGGVGAGIGGVGAVIMGDVGVAVPIENTLACLTTRLEILSVCASFLRGSPAEFHWGTEGRGALTCTSASKGCLTVSLTLSHWRIEGSSRGRGPRGEARALCLPWTWSPFWEGDLWPGEIMPHPPEPCGISTSMGSPLGKGCNALNTPRSTSPLAEAMRALWSWAIIPWERSPRQGVVLLVSHHKGVALSLAWPWSPEAHVVWEDGVSLGLQPGHTKEVSIWPVSSAGDSPPERRSTEGCWMWYKSFPGQVTVSHLGPQVPGHMGPGAPSEEISGSTWAGRVERCSRSCPPPRALGPGHGRFCLGWFLTHLAQVLGTSLHVDLLLFLFPPVAASPTPLPILQPVVTPISEQLMVSPGLSHAKPRGLRLLCTSCQAMSSEGFKGRIKILSPGENLWAPVWEDAGEHPVPMGSIKVGEPWGLPGWGERWLADLSAPGGWVSFLLDEGSAGGLRWIMGRRAELLPPEWGSGGCKEPVRDTGLGAGQWGHGEHLVWVAVRETPLGKGADRTHGRLERERERPRTLAHKDQLVKLGHSLIRSDLRRPGERLGSAGSSAAVCLRVFPPPLSSSVTRLGLLTTCAPSVVHSANTRAHATAQEALFQSPRSITGPDRLRPLLRGRQAGKVIMVLLEVGGERVPYWGKDSCPEAPSRGGQAGGHKERRIRGQSHLTLAADSQAAAGAGGGQVPPSDLLMVEMSPWPVHFPGAWSAEVGEAAGVSVGGDQGFHQGLSHGGLSRPPSWRHAWAGEGHSWLSQAESVDLGSLTRGWGSKLSVNETPGGVMFGVQVVGELMVLSRVGWMLGPEPGLRILPRAAMEGKAGWGRAKALGRVGEGGSFLGVLLERGGKWAGLGKEEESREGWRGEGSPAGEGREVPKGGRADDDDFLVAGVALGTRMCARGRRLCGVCPLPLALTRLEFPECEKGMGLSCWAVGFQPEKEAFKGAFNLNVNMGNPGISRRQASPHLRKVEAAFSTPPSPPIFTRELGGKDFSLMRLALGGAGTPLPSEVRLEPAAPSAPCGCFLAPQSRGEDLTNSLPPPCAGEGRPGAYFCPGSPCSHSVSVTGPFSHQEPLLRKFLPFSCPAVGLLTNWALLKCEDLASLRGEGRPRRGQAQVQAGHWAGPGEGRTRRGQAWGGQTNPRADLGHTQETANPGEILFNFQEMTLRGNGYLSLEYRREQKVGEARRLSLRGAVCQHSGAGAEKTGQGRGRKPEQPESREAPRGEQRWEAWLPGRARRGLRAPRGVFLPLAAQFTLCDSSPSPRLSPLLYPLLPLPSSCLPPLLPDLLPSPLFLCLF